MLTFPGQKENEQVLHVVHRHWFNLASHFFLLLVIFVIIFGGISFFLILFPEATDAGGKKVLVFIQNSFFLFMWLYSFMLWIDYYFDVWIITDERILNIEQKGLFIRTISEVHYSRIQDISTSVNGIIPTVLNFGDLLLQTASENERISFRQVGDPNGLKDEIMRLAKRDRLGL
ncbi:MAG: PH domain-containing protein [Candidatus Moranbacteria bacterium]|nr:PH domain-containing protein [Candidatus Moranbacteria bacterium]